MQAQFAAHLRCGKVGRSGSRSSASAVADASLASSGINEMGSAFRQRSRRLLAVCVTVSLALHVVAFTALPGFVSDHKPLEVRVLDVVLLKPDVPPVATPEPPKPLPHASRQPARQHEPLPKNSSPDFPPTAVEEQRRPDSAASMLTLSERQGLTELELRVPSASPAESRGVPVAKTEGTTQSSTASITPPGFAAAYLRNPPPRYPLVARRNGEQGTVTLRVLVTREGLPASVNVEKTSGSGHLDSAALEAVRTWRFAPARQGTQPIEAWVLVPIVFRLEGSS